MLSRASAAERGLVGSVKEVRCRDGKIRRGHLGLVVVNQLAGDSAQCFVGLRNSQQSSRAV